MSAAQNTLRVCISECDSSIVRARGSDRHHPRGARRQAQGGGEGGAGRNSAHTGGYHGGAERHRRRRAQPGQAPNAHGRTQERPESALSLLSQLLVGCRPPHGVCKVSLSVRRPLPFDMRFAGRQASVFAPHRSW